MGKVKAVEPIEALYQSANKGELSDIPSTIKRMRRQAGITQAEYAKLVGIDLTTLRSAEQGREVSVNTLNKIGKPFKLTVGYVVKK